MRINVTQQHIDKGIARSFINCPVALAIKEHTEFRILVWDFVELWDDRSGCRLVTNAKLPERIIDWINDFDRRRKMQPITFELEWN